MEIMGPKMFFSNAKIQREENEENLKNIMDKGVILNEILETLESMKQYNYKKEIQSINNQFYSLYIEAKKQSEDYRLEKEKSLFEGKLKQRVRFEKAREAIELKK